MNGKISKTDFLKGILLTAALLVLGGVFSPLYSQEPPPRPVVITVNNSQPMAFGAFTPGASGGSITVPPDGSVRTSSGTVIPLSLGMLHSPAMFYVRANPGTVISVLSGTTSTLTVFTLQFQIPAGEKHFGVSITVSGSAAALYSHMTSISSVPMTSCRCFQNITSQPSALRLQCIVSS